MKRVILATTGSSFISNSLLEEKSISLVGIVDFCPHILKIWESIIKSKTSYIKYDNNLDTLEAWIKTLKPDILIIYKMPFLLSEKIFSLPKYGSVNIHPSLLPKYRGPNPWFWIYYNMETIGGITIHRVDKYEDHGEILAQKSFNIELGEELHHLQSRAEQIIYPILLYLIFNIETVRGPPQAHISVQNRAPNISDYSSIVDLKKMDGIYVWHLLRGFPNLLTSLIGKNQCKYLIGDFIFDSIVNKSNIGQIIHDNKNSYLSCINGRILIKSF